MNSRLRIHVKASVTKTAVRKQTFPERQDLPEPVQVFPDTVRHPAPPGTIPETEQNSADMRME